MMSEKASDSPPASESAAPATPAKGGKKMWVAIVAVIVVVALVVAGLWMAGIFGTKITDKFDATMTPGTVVINAGKDIELTVNPTWKDEMPTKGKLVYLWSATPNTLGEFDRVAQKTVTYSAGNEAGTGTIKCNVTYEYDSKHTFYVDLTAILTINPPVIESVVVVPSERTLIPGMTQTFFASAYNSVEEELPNATFAWTCNLTASKYSLNATTGSSVLFEALELGEGLLTATATDNTGTAVGTAVVHIVSELPARNATILWYDLFEVPNEPFWDLRWDVTGLDEPLTDSYPYLYRWYGAQEGNTWIYTSMRMNVTGRNMYEANMNENPVFLPMFGNFRGGTADIRWYANYMNMDETERYPAFVGSQIDGWLWILNGTVTLDKSAARSVLGINSADFDTDFNGWWGSNGEKFKLDYTDWLNNEGKVRIDIFNSYEYPFTMLYLDITAQKVGDKVVLTYDTVSWGLDVLIAMQMWDAHVIDTYWYYEDFWFNATIGPEKMNLNLDCAPEYAVYAYETTLEGTPCWEWEALIQDVAPATAEHPRSNYTPYQNAQYEMLSPGSPIYGDWLTYDYAPSAWNLTENETLIIEWPAGDQMFLVNGGDYYGCEQVYGEFEIRHSEPMDTVGLDMPPGQFAIDNASRQIIFQGPFDMWKWSKDQTHNENLASEWDRIGVLPYGIPTIELALELSEYRYPVHFKIWNITNPVDLDTAIEFTVKVYDQYWQPYPFYNGTVRFFSNDTAAVLPGDFTFSNAGEANLTVVFNTKGYRNLTVVDVGNASIYGHKLLIEVGPEAARLVIEEIPFYAMRDTPFSLRVTAYDQFGNVFTNYTGTVHFVTTDTDLAIMLPADYEFVQADEGTHLFEDGFILMTLGNRDITVNDTSNAALANTTTLEVIASAPQSKTYTISDMFEEPFGEWWPKRWPFYGTDVIVSDEPGMSAYYFMPLKTDVYQGMIYAPYRYSIDAVNQSRMSVDRPVMMPMYGPVVDGSSAQMHVYFQYLYNDWWWDYWVPTWSGHATFDALVSGSGQFINRSTADGYDLGAVVSVRLNREAAEQWLDMPQTANVATWWAANEADYTTKWQSWAIDQGNNVFDIYCGYEWTYQVVGGTWCDLVEDGATGDVTLTIGHVTLGYEILMVRWLAWTKMSPLEPYFEDFNLWANYSKYVANVSLNGVAQYSMHAVKANGTANGAAWVWEPAKIDYVTKVGHKSDYRPYVPLQYQSWNAGDTFLGQQVSYEQTPTWFNLSATDEMIVQLPTGTVPGYEGVALTDTDIETAILGDRTPFYNIMQNGTMDLGYYITGWPEGTGADLSTMYNAGTKTLTIDGPQAFNNFWHTPTGLLYHGVPWIEFNVSAGKAAAASTPEVSGGSALTPTSATFEVLSMAVVVSATMLSVAALGACARRKL